tara:strand:- start:778 stop:1173 length:396 start_codon:yes stop_codon:yes gene_type:complete
MAEETPTVFGPKATEQIAKTVREVARRMMNPRGERGRWQFQGTTNRAAVIGTDLTAPASSLVAATSCTIYFLDIQSDGTRVLNTTSETAYNDDPDITADLGTYCRVERLDGRWMIYYLGCHSQAALIAEIP